VKWLTKLLEKLFRWLRGRRPQAVAAEAPVAKVAPRRKLPKTGGAFGHPRWMRIEGVRPLGGEK
jgi:hypothetical protein